MAEKAVRFDSNLPGYDAVVNEVKTHSLGDDGAKSLLPKLEESGLELITDGENLSISVLNPHSSRSAYTHRGSREPYSFEVRATQGKIVGLRVPGSSNVSVEARPDGAIVSIPFTSREVFAMKVTYTP